MLDGFPRNLVQAEALDEMLAEIGRPLDCVVLLRSRRRHRDRARCSGAPTTRAVRTTRPRSIARRLAIYHEQTEPVVERYRAAGDALRRSTASGTVDEVFAEIEAALQSR